MIIEMPRNVTSPFSKEDYVKFMRIYQFLLKHADFICDHENEFHEMIDAIVMDYEEDKPF